MHRILDPVLAFLDLDLAAAAFASRSCSFSRS
jgi:hypothetical protein